MKSPSEIYLLSLLSALFWICLFVGGEVSAITLNLGDILLIDDGGCCEPHRLGWVTHINPTTGAQTIISFGNNLVDPLFLAIDPIDDINGNILVADRNALGGNGAVIRINPQNGAQTIVSSGGSFRNPSGIAVAPNGDIFISDPSAFGATGTVFQVDRMNGGQTVICSGGGSGHIAREASGNILAIDEFKNSVLRCNLNTLQFTTVSQGQLFRRLSRIAVARNGFIYVTDTNAKGGGFGGGALIRVNPTNGQQSFACQNIVFSFPNSFAIDADGSFLVHYEHPDHTFQVFRLRPLTFDETGTPLTCDQTLISPIPPDRGVLFSPTGFAVVQPVVQQPIVPVVLVHGFCGSSATFNKLDQLLKDDLGVKVLYFIYNDSEESNVSEPDDRKNLIELARRLGEFIKANKGSSPQVDVVTHSMGGLITRAWIAGLTVETYNNEIRRLVLAGTPNFGLSSKSISGIPGRPPSCSEQTDVAKAQKAQMFYGSQFLKFLNEAWEDKVDTGLILPRPQDIMTIVGCTRSPVLPNTCDTDGVVAAPSASLPPKEAGDYVVTYVGRDHWGDMVSVDDANHETYQMIKAFLTGKELVSAYNPDLVSWLFITPLVNTGSREPFTITHGIRFGQSCSFSRVLEVCEIPVLEKPCKTPDLVISIEQHEPFDSDGQGGSPVTGWWTITPDPKISIDAFFEGCLNVVLDKKSKYQSSSVPANVRSGRPIITNPLEVEAAR